MRLIRRWILVPVGCIATVLAVAGVVLPGLPTTPFLLVALWAFARSSDALNERLHRIPLLRHALAEAHRFEERRAVRPAVKWTAVSVAWASVVVTAVSTRWGSPYLLASVALAAIAATLFMWWIPSDRA
ncbi:MAG: YbaN family protein [Hyphomicrobiaceae bacterium]